MLKLQLFFGDAELIKYLIINNPNASFFRNMATEGLKIALNSLILILENSIDEFPRGQLSPELLRQAKTDNFSVLKVY